MNKAITDGIVFMPPPFSGGLDVWSKGDGTPGSATYDGDPNAALVPSDADFAGCLELNKTTGTQKIRYMGETPILPGCYLKVTARVKAVAGNLPSVRIAASLDNSPSRSEASVPTAAPSACAASRCSSKPYRVRARSISQPGTSLSRGEPHSMLSLRCFRVR